MKVIKWFFVSILVIVICLALYLTFLFDLNDYKPELVDLVKDKTGRDLIIGKDLKWTVYPSLGIEIGKLSLSAPKGFKNNMVTVNKAVAEVSFLPLLSKEVEVNRLNFDGINLNLVTKKDGRTSLDGLSANDSPKSQSEQVEKQREPQGSNVNLLNSLHINGVLITNVTVNKIDEKNRVSSNFTVEHIQLDDFDLAKDSKLSFDISADVANNKIESSGEGVINISQDLVHFALKSLDIETRISGLYIPNGLITNKVMLDAEVNTKAKMASFKIDNFKLDHIESSGSAKINFASSVPQINASLDVGDVNLTKFILSTEKDETKEKTAKRTEVKNSGTEPDLSGLRAVNADIAFTVKSIQLKKIKTNNWSLVVNLKNGALKVKDFSGHLYQGKLAASASLLAKNKVPNYQFKTKLTGVQVQPLLKDAMDSEILAGTTFFNLTGHGTSLNTNKILENLFAQGRAEFTDGAIYGVNIPLMIRNAKAKLKGEPVENVTEKKTDFTRLGTNFKINKGVVRLDKSEMASPLLRVKGEGEVNLVKKTVDYLLQTEIVATLKGQNSEKDDLSGLKIPLRISGEISDPNFSIDTKALLDQKINQEKKKLKDKLKDKLFKRLGL